jgi:hypothetical protein
LGLGYQLELLFFAIWFGSGRKAGKLTAVPLLLKAGVTVKQIAEQLDIEGFRQAGQQS